MEGEGGGEKGGWGGAAAVEDNVAMTKMNI